MKVKVTRLLWWLWWGGGGFLSDNDTKLFVLFCVDGRIVAIKVKLLLWSWWLYKWNIATDFGYSLALAKPNNILT